MVERYEYDAYGAVSFFDHNYTSIPNSAFNNEFLFTGQMLDSETGLYYYKNRHYNPQLGRFQQRDPLGYDEGINLYQYVNSNPVNWIDPQGLEACRVETLKKDFEIPNRLKGFLKRIGLEELTSDLSLNLKACGGCCEETKKIGFSVDLDLSAKFEIKFGSPKFDFYSVQAKIGWYGAISLDESISGGFDKCGNGSGEFCITVGGSVGGVAEVIAESNFGGIKSKVQGGGKAGVNSKLTLCLKCDAGACTAKFKVCSNITVKVYLLVETPIYSRNYNVNYEVFGGCADDFEFVAYRGQGR